MKFKFLDKVTCTTEFHCETIGTVVGNCANQYRVRFNLFDATGKYCSFYDDTIEECFLRKLEELELTRLIAGFSFYRQCIKRLTLR